MLPPPQIGQFAVLYLNEEEDKQRQFGVGKCVKHPSTPRDQFTLRLYESDSEYAGFQPHFDADGQPYV